MTNQNETKVQCFMKKLVRKQLQDLPQIALGHKSKEQELHSSLRKVVSHVVG